MAHTDDRTGFLPCVWMTAGLVSYKLCDREYDCDHCPLDAALRGVARPAGGPKTSAERGEHAVGPLVFPEDRRYAHGHTWALAVGDGPAGRMRVGLDGFAAALLRPPGAVRFPAAGTRLATGAPMCELDLGAGIVPLAAPVAGELVASNPALAGTPALACTDPYGRGWLAEIAPADGEPERLAGAAEARRWTGHDLHLFRRRIAVGLLDSDRGVGASMPDGGEWVTDVRALLGAARYLDLVRELLR